MTLKTDAEAVRTAARCRHYAMCKIDSLGADSASPAGKKASSATTHRVEWTSTTPWINAGLDGVL
jgi:hypothetical protein